MVKQTLTSLRGLFIFLLYCLNIIVMGIPFFILGIFKLLLPFKSLNPVVSYCAQELATLWITLNCFIIDTFHPVTLKISGPDIQGRNAWFLLIANHQSWVDILIIQRVFKRNIPLLKFFIKKELIWLPIAGVIWWALGYPLLSRHSKSQIAKNPALKDIDINKTMEACEKFNEYPTAVGSFVEGTRFTPEKHQQQNSPYKHLLKPKAGGISLVLNSLQTRIKEIINVTVVYPKGPNGFWDFICGRITTISLEFETIPVTPNLIGDYAHDPVFQQEFQGWLNNLWLEKDHTIDKILNEL